MATIIGKAVEFMSIPPGQTGQGNGVEQRAEIASIGHVLKNRNFLLLWMAQLISLTVLNAANFALVVLMNTRPDGALMASVAIIAFTLPAVPFSAMAGVIVDRMNKRMILWVSNLLRVFTMLMMFAWLLYDRSNPWPLIGLMFLTSLVGQFFIPAEGASIPLLVGQRDLMPALSLFNISMTISQAIGFLLLGRMVVALFQPFAISLPAFSVQVQPTDMVFVLAALLYIVCIFLILFIPPRAFEELHLRRKGDGRATYQALGHVLPSLWRDMLAGWRVVRSDHLLFFSVIQLSVVGIIMQLIAALAGTFVQVILHRPAEDISVVLAPAAVGLVAASVFMSHITERVGKIRLTLIGLVVLAVGFTLIPVLHWIALAFDPAHGSESGLLFWVIVLLVFGLGVAMASVNIPTQTMMQERSPEEGRARVLSLQFMIYSAGTVSVLPFAAAIAQFMGFSQVVLIVSASLLLFCVWGAWYLKQEQRVEAQHVIEERELVEIKK